MKKGLVFILGPITGMILNAITLFVISKEYSKERGPVLNMSEQQIPFITATKFKIFQVADNGALANTLVLFLPFQDQLFLYLLMVIISFTMIR